MNRKDLIRQNRQLRARVRALESRICCPISQYPEWNTITGYVELRPRDGHIFGFRRGPGTPGMIYATCVACGFAHHELFPEKHR